MFLRESFTNCSQLSLTPILSGIRSGKLWRPSLGWRGECCTLIMQTCYLAAPVESIVTWSLGFGQPLLPDREPEIYLFVFVCVCVCNLLQVFGSPSTIISRFIPVSWRQPCVSIEANEKLCSYGSQKKKENHTSFILSTSQRSWMLQELKVKREK